MMAVESRSPQARAANWRWRDGHRSLEVEAAWWVIIVLAA